MDDIPGPASGPLLATLQLCLVRGYYVQFFDRMPWGDSMYSVTKPAGFRLTFYPDASGLIELLAFMDSTQDCEARFALLWDELWMQASEENRTWNRQKLSGPTQA